MGDYLKNEYSKRDEEIENAELYALITILDTLRPIRLGEKTDFQKMVDNIDNVIRLLEQKIERRNKWTK